MMGTATANTVYTQLNTQLSTIVEFILKPCTAFWIMVDWHVKKEMA